jgi:hypothetical protein
MIRTGISTVLKERRSRSRSHSRSYLEVTTATPRRGMQAPATHSESAVQALKASCLLRGAESQRTPARRILRVECGVTEPATD